MNRNGTPMAIILIYLMTTQPLFMDRRRKCQVLVYGSSAPSSRINLYSRFKDRLNATSNFAESEYDVKTSEVLDSIYGLTGDILREQLEQARTEDDSQNTNYTDKLFDVADPLGSRDSLFPAVASSTVVAITTIAANTAAYVAEKNLTLINAPVVVSNAEQSNHRRARKIQKASRIFRRTPRSRPPMKSCLGTSIGKGQSSRPAQPLPSFFGTTARDGVRGKLSTISTQSQERQYATLEQQKAAYNIDESSQWRGTMNSHDAGSGQKMNGLAEKIQSEGDCDGDGGNDDSSNRSGSSSDKWRRKLQIDGRKNNLRKCRPWPILFGEEQSNEVIQSGEDVYGADEMSQQHKNGGVFYTKDYGSHMKARSADSFPEVFSRPLVGNGNGLNEAIKNANSLLTTVEGVASNAKTPAINFDDSSSHRIGKQIQTLSEVPLNGHNAAGDYTPIGSDGSTANLTNVMEKVLDELESLKECKAADDVQPEGSPCDVAGSWNSETIGLQFHISIANPSTSSRTFVEGKSIEIELTEKVPPRRHDLMDCDWFLTGSTIKQVGGPFYMTAQKADSFIVATFAGLCKTCGGIPTIFGSWTFVYPAKDCQDISLAVENKRDVLRRDTLDAKRKHRREKLGSKDKGKCSNKSIF